MPNVSEVAFERVIESVLLAGGPDDPQRDAAVAESAGAYGGGQTRYQPGGYHKRSSADYDATQCLIPRDAVEFVQVTQPKMWAKLVKNMGGSVAEAKARFLKILAREVERRGVLDVLRSRKSVKLDGCRFDMAYFKPVSGLNPDTQRLYQGNRFAVLRQLHYRPNDPAKPKSGPSIDLAIFLNGLPLFTAELKNKPTGQDVRNAMKQYEDDRDPKQALLTFRRCLAHFAVDSEDVYVTTKLDRDKTRFLPFNQGYGNGAGNEPKATGFATDYLWTQVWARDSVLNLIQHFIHEFEVEDEKGRKTGEIRLIFPRYHQLDAVRRLVQDAYLNGAGQRYLIQHSAGSGKSNSIAWLAHQLTSLHDASNERVFNSVIVITDRRVLDRQLQRTIRQFQQVDGVVENIDKTSRQLRQALLDGKQIIVTTLQKFPVIVKSIGELPGQRFAVLVDEAHSSQSGESTKSLKAVLTVSGLEDAAAEEEAFEGDEVEELLQAAADQRRMPPNVSFFAFTATPKAKTLELFGHRQADGSLIPFSLYAMRQAIEEGFIKDVLQNYTTYKTYWNLLKTIETDPRYERDKAAYLLRSFVELHDHAIEQKGKVILDHLETQVLHHIEGEAKAMLVTRSRLHALRYKLAVDAALAERGLAIKALVAFSGKVTDPRDGETYTEASLNGFSDKQTAETFKQRAYRLLIVANKFQTGFDQPLLHTMYVDKKLGGVNAVQTLSRLNRTHPDKESTAVLDFVNSAEDIQAAFQPYYDRVLLSEQTDPQLLYDLERKLTDFLYYSEADLDNFMSLYFSEADNNVILPQLHGAVAHIVERFTNADTDEQIVFRKSLTDYIRLYAFLSQIARFSDTELEKLYIFGRFLRSKLPSTPDALPIEVQQQIDIESFRIIKTGKHNISLERGAAELDPVRAKDIHGQAASEIDTLSSIISDLNQRYGFSDVSDEEVVTLQRVEARLDDSEALRASAKVNTPDNLRLSFNNEIMDIFQELLDSNFKLYKKITDQEDFADRLTSVLFERYIQRQTGDSSAIGAQP